MQYKTSDEITEPGIYHTLRPLSKPFKGKNLNEFLKIIIHNDGKLGTWYEYDISNAMGFEPSHEFRFMESKSFDTTLFYGPLKEKINPNVQVDDLTIQKIKDKLLIKEIIK